MLTRRLLMLMLICWLPAQSAQSADDAGDAPRAEEAVAEAGGDAAEGENTDEDAAPPQGSVGGQMGEVTLERFIPTEEITADGAVSFPVDI